MVRRGIALAVMLALSVALVACGGSSDEETPAEVAEMPAPAGETSSGGLGGLVEHLRDKSFQLWDVYNTHDPDALEGFYSDDYWEEEKESLRSNMQPFKDRGLTFTAEETSPPTEIAPGKWETRHTARYPGGEVKMVFVYEEFLGEWLLTHLKPE